MSFAKPRSAFRKLRVETLCTRQLMAADIAVFPPFVGVCHEDRPTVEIISHAHSNPYMKASMFEIDLDQGLSWQVVDEDQQIETLEMDVNRDGHVSPLDALVLVNHLNTEGSVYENALDVNDDGIVSSKDCLAVIHFLNRNESQHMAGGECSPDQWTWSPRNQQTIDNPQQDHDVGRSAVDFISKLINVKREDLVLERVNQVDWPDSGLGLGGLAYFVITPGHQVIVRHGSVLHEVRSSTRGYPVYGGYELIRDHLQDEEASECAWMNEFPSLEALEDAMDSIDRRSTKWPR